MPISRSLCTAVDFVQVPFTKFLHGFRLVVPDGLQPLSFLFLDALLPPSVVGGPEDGTVFGVGFACSSLSCWKLHCLLSNTAPLLSIDSKLLAHVSILSFLASKIRSRSF